MHISPISKVLDLKLYRMCFLSQKQAVFLGNTLHHEQKPRSHYKHGAAHSCPLVGTTQKRGGYYRAIASLQTPRHHISECLRRTV